MLKNFLLKLDEYLPDDIFAMIIKEFESNKPFIEKVRSSLKISLFDFSLAAEEINNEFKSDKPFIEKVKAFLP